MRRPQKRLLATLLPYLFFGVACGAAGVGSTKTDAQATGDRQQESHVGNVQTTGTQQSHAVTGDQGPAPEGGGDKAVVFIDRTDENRRDLPFTEETGGDDRESPGTSPVYTAEPSEALGSAGGTVTRDGDEDDWSTRQARRRRAERRAKEPSPKPSKDDAPPSTAYDGDGRKGEGGRAEEGERRTRRRTHSDEAKTVGGESRPETKPVYEKPDPVEKKPDSKPPTVEKLEFDKTGATEPQDEPSDVKKETVPKGTVDAVQVWDDKANWTEFELAVNKVGPVYTEPGDLPHLEIVFVDDIVIQDFVDEYDIERTWNGKVEVPLEHTHVDARLSGPVGRVHVQQRYTNPFKQPIEAVYVFPLPENSAVDGMRMVIGERVVEGVVREKEEARQMYEEAKAAGHIAALLEQERPNVFTQSVANIPPGQRINIDTRYVQDLSYDSGTYEFVFPMVVGPRYVPGNIGDGARVSPPVIGAGSRSGHDISLTVSADAGMPIRSYEVPTHDVEGAIDGAGRLTVRLADLDTIPNRDFVLRYKVAGDQPQIAVLSERNAKTAEGFFTLIVQPPEADVNALVGTRQVVFVVDVSGSMAGVPLAMSQEAMTESLRRLRPVDTFNIVTFASSAQRLFDGARPANRKNIEEGMAFVEAMEAGGGTRMMGGITESLSEPLEPGMKRVVVFMTDGFIGNEDQVLEAIGKNVAAIAEKHAEARVFAMGVGSSTNRYLIDGLAKEGNGAAVYALNREDPRKAVDTFFAVIDHPILTDVEIDWGGLDVNLEETYPRKAPDLMVSQPLVLHGRYGKTGKGKAVLKGRSQGELLQVSFPVELSDKEAHDGLLGTLWARSAVEQLQRDMLYSADYEGLRKKIVRLGVAHGIVTQFTSFVAIDSEVVEGGGNPMRVEQPVERPEDVRP